VDSVLDDATVSLVPAWSHTVALAWPPSLRFFERRSDLLAQLESQDLVSAFRWSENVIGARLGRGEVLEVSSLGAMLITIGPDARPDKARDGLKLAIETVEPTDLRLTQALFQFMLPVDREYALARRQSARQLITPLLPQASPEDWSLLVDGRSRLSNAPFQVEFGVIDEREAPDRLSRRVGRMHAHELAPFPEDFFEDHEYPECALFFDWRWFPNRQFAPTAVDPDLFAFWDALAGESEEMCRTVQSGVGLVEESRDTDVEAER